MIVSKVSQQTPLGFVAVPDYAGRFIADVADIISASGPRSAVTSHAGTIHNAHESHNDSAARRIGRGLSTMLISVHCYCWTREGAALMNRDLVRC